jgi:hypothetical protein
LNASRIGFIPITSVSSTAGPVSPFSAPTRPPAEELLIAGFSLGVWPLDYALTIRVPGGEQLFAALHVVIEFTLTPSF